MEVRQIMTRPVITVPPDAPVALVASSMRDHGIGALPVLDAGRLAGIITDRDLALALLPRVASAFAAEARDMMTTKVLVCYAESDVEEAAAIMGEHQVRRLPVLERSGKLVGILSVGDIAREVSEWLAGEALGEIVEDR